nr:hypothetical protein [Tanacetum cinerariifolium]
MTSKQVFRQQQQAFHNHQLNNQFQNLQHQRNTPFQNLQQQQEAFQQSQPQPRFKEPQPPTKDNHRGKRMAKRATVNLVEDDEEEEQTCQCARWTREEEILMSQLDRKLRERRHRSRSKRGFVLATDYDAPEPLDTDDHTKISGPDVRPRPTGKTRPAKRPNLKRRGAAGEVRPSIPMGLVIIVFVRVMLLKISNTVQARLVQTIHMNPPIKNSVSVTEGSTSVSNKQMHSSAEGPKEYELIYMPIHRKRIRLKRGKSEQKRTKMDKTGQNGKCVEAGKSLKQLQ